MRRRLFIVGFLLIISTLVWYRSALRPLSSDTSRIGVKIEKGMTVKDIAHVLEERGVIRSSFAFRLFTRFGSKQSSLQAGQFFLTPAMSVAEVVDALHRGMAEEFAVTIPEGYTVSDIDALLVRRGLIAPGDLVACARTCDFSNFDFLPPAQGLADRGGRLEGYLYPETYFVLAANFEPQAFLSRMLTTFRARVIDRYSDTLARSPRTLHQIVTMASLVEEESRHDEERAFVAGILWKRLDNKVLLGVDAAVRYIINKPTEAITKTDLQVDSPYNVRRFHGLPPGPIASPGASSIEATLKPQESRFWYYLHDAQGRIHYAETNDEHNLNRAKHL